MIEFKYNVITRANGDKYDLSPNWWARHPHWKFYVRTNVRYHANPKVWLGGGGATLEEAIAVATESVEVNAGRAVTLLPEMMAVLGPQKAKGTLTDEVIKNKE